MTPYDTSVEHLRDELLRIELVLDRHIEMWRGDRAAGNDGLRGLYVTDEQVDSLLDSARNEKLDQTNDRPDQTGQRSAHVSTDAESAANDHSEIGAGDQHTVTSGRATSTAQRTETQSDTQPDPGSSRSGSGRSEPQSEAQAGLDERLASVARAIRARKQQTLDEETELRLVELADRFGLDHRHVDILLLALAPEIDRKYGTVYAYLQDDMTQRRPSVGLLVEILGESWGERLAARSSVTQPSPLRRHDLLRLSDQDGLLSQTARVDERIVDYLLGSDDVDDALAEFTTVVDPAERLSELRIDEESRAAVEQIAGRCASSEGQPLLVSFSGPDGSGIEAAVEAVCAETGETVLRIDAGEIAVHEASEVLRRLVREAQLQNAVVHVANLPAEAPPTESPQDVEQERAPAERVGRLDPEHVLQAMDEFDGTVFVTGTERRSPTLGAQLSSHEFAATHFSMPSYDQRCEYWRAVDLPETVDPTDLATKFQLTAGQIEDAVEVARSLDITTDSENGTEDPESVSAASIYAGCRAQTREQLGSMARQVEPQYTWDDIVLPADRLAHLREVAMHVEHRGRVYADWGFEDRYSLGNGINVLFTGPSGTGKTMAAEIIANDVGLDLFKVDLSTVVSKYVGETEKNLRNVFDEAENSNAILFFDEADALFGKRTEVEDSHDRYANVEVSYLLQRMEEHDGAVLLASNLGENVDDAFRRRINLQIDFPFPDQDSREAIWRGVFPAETPRGDLDIEFLSSFELAGGNVKNAALTAAFLAADDDGVVEMAHVVKALRRELRKTDQLVTPEKFAEYQEYLDQ